MQAVFLAILGAVLCLSSARAQNFTCEFDSPLSLPEDSDIRVTTTRTSRRLEDGPNPDGTELEPLAGDHDLILGDCEAPDLDFTFTLNMCVYPDPDNGTATQRVLVQLPGASVIGCVRILDTYNNTEGEDLGGYPFVDDGGIGYDFVQLRFESQEAQGMKFEIVIKGYDLQTTTAEPTTAEPTTAEPTTAEPTPDTTPAETTVPPFSNDL